jgi:hypothetical protein
VAVCHATQRPVCELGVASIKHEFPWRFQSNREAVWKLHVAGKEKIERVFQPPKITNRLTLLCGSSIQRQTIFGKRSYFTAKNKNTALTQLTFSIKGNFLTGVVP